MLDVAPNTEWLGDAVALDDKGFVLTGASVRPDQQRWSHALAHPLATSCPSVRQALTEDPDRQRDPG